MYDAADPEENNTAGPWIPDLGDMLDQKEKTLQLLESAALIFPKAEKEIEILCTQLSKFVKE